MAKFTRLEVLNTIVNTGLVPVFYNGDVEVTKKVAWAIATGGCRLLEFTNRGDFAPEVFKDLSRYCQQELPNLILGVGSILDAPTAALYVAYGANFVVGPYTNPEVARFCNRRKISYSPGCGSDREGLSRTEGAAGVMGDEGRGEAGPGGARASAGDGSGHAPGKDPTYSFSASIRVAIPAYRANPSPEYPAIARRRGYEGTVLVEVLVNRDGRVEDLRLSQSSGYPMLDQAAMTSMRGWLFEPATINEKKVEMWVKVPVRFHLK